MRKYRRLTRADRIIIERRLEQGKSKTEIAEELGFDRSSISREIKRNKAVKGPYRWRGAQAKAVDSKRQLESYSRKIEGPLEELVVQWLEACLSPEQISNRLKLENAQWNISHETIYQWIYKHRSYLIEYLRWKHRKRQKRSGLHRRSIQSESRKMINERPEGANQRREIGHWERDLLIGKISGPALLVIQDRKTRYSIIKKVNNKSCAEVNRATIEALKTQTVNSTTNDNGCEFVDYLPLEGALRAPVYFCHPYTSSERGTVENTNGLIRQYFPKGHDFSEVTNDTIQAVQDAINNRPRKTLGWRSAREIHDRVQIKMVLSESTYNRHAGDREAQGLKDWSDYLDIELKKEAI